MGKPIIKAMQIAAAYIGTVVGAGFATGQEILRFFTIYQGWGLLGIAITAVLFIILGTKMMVLSHRINAYSYQEFNINLFGRKIGNLINALLTVVLLGVTGVMVSATGAIFNEQLGYSPYLGIFISTALCYLLIQKGLQSILTVNSIVVPMILTFCLIIFTQTGIAGLYAQLGQIFPSLSPPSISPPISAPITLNTDGGHWLISALSYAAFNLAMAQAVLVPMGRDVQNEKTLIAGGILGGIGLGFMLFCSHMALYTILPDALTYDIPMAFIVKTISPLALFLFLAVVYGEVFTTLIGNVFGLTRQLKSLTHMPEKSIIAIILLLSMIISQVGFSALVSHLYPIFGYASLILLLCLTLKKLPKKR